jgi:hypothetical protein
MASAGAVGLLVLALGVLFAIREVFIEKPKRQKSFFGGPRFRRV